MSSVDNRIVNMQFNNKQFQGGITDSLRSLQQLEGALGVAAKSVGLKDMAKSVDYIASRFSALQVAGYTAIANITSRAINMGTNFVKSFTISPITEGFKNYEQQINALQTITSNVGQDFKTPEKAAAAVTAALDRMNKYANLTIYDFKDMATNLGTFTAAGVKLPEAEKAVLGVANVAALAGAGTQQAAAAMYQLSQALGRGKVTAQDWNSVVANNLSTYSFQRALLETSRAMGLLKINTKGPINVTTDFRAAMEKGEITSKVLSNTLGYMSGKLTETQKKAIGYSKAQQTYLDKVTKTASDSATHVKTFTQLMDNLRQTAASGWASTFKILIGDLPASIRLFTKISDKVSDILNKQTDRRNELANAFKKNGGLVAFGDSVTNILTSISGLFGAVRDGFREIFPATTGKQLADTAKQIQAFTRALIPSAHTLDDLKRTFAGVFAVLHVGVTVIRSIRALFFGFLDGLVKGLSGGNLGILDFTAKIGDLLVKIDKFITRGGKVVDFFHNVGEAAGKSVGKIVSFGANIVQGLVGGMIDTAKGYLTKAVTYVANLIPDTIKKVLGIHSPARVMIPIGQNIVQGIIVGIKATFSAIGNAILDIGHFIGQLFGKIFGGDNALNFASLLNAFLAGGTLIAIRQFFKSLDKVANIGTAIKGTLDQLTNTLKTMTVAIRANALKAIAISVALLAAALLVLTFIPAEKLAIGLGALGTMMGLLVGSLWALAKIDTKAKLSYLSASLVAVSTSILILSGAVAILGSLSLQTLGKGLGALAIALALLVGAMIGISKFTRAAPVAAGAMLSMAIAINLLVVAVSALGLLPIKVIAQGIGAIALLLGIMVASMVGISKFTTAAPVAAGAMLAMATALDILVVAVASLGVLPFKVLAKGIGSIVFLLAALTASMVAMSVVGPSSAIAAGGMLLIATALTAILPMLLILGNTSWDVLVKGFAALTAILTLFTVAIVALGLAAEVLAPGLLALGAALFLAGAGFALAGVGFGLIAASGTAALAVMTAGITAFIALLPAIATQMLAAMVAFLQALAAAAPKVVGALVKIVSAALDGVVALSGKFATTAIVLILAFLAAVNKYLPQFIVLGGNIIVNLITGIAGQAARIANAMINGLITVLAAVGSAAKKNGSRLGVQLVQTAEDIMSGLVSGITGAGKKLLHDAWTTITGFIPGWVKDVLGIHSPSRVMAEIGVHAAQGLANGILNSTGKIKDAAIQLAKNVINGIAKVPGAAVNGVKNLVSGVGDALSGAFGGGDFGDLRHQILLQLRDSGVLSTATKAQLQQLANTLHTTLADVSSYIPAGVAKGIENNTDVIKKSTVGMATTVKKTFTGEMNIQSPSKIAIYWGEMIAKGVGNGITANIKAAVGATVALANAVIAAGSTAVAKAQETARKAQIAADAAAARAAATRLAASKVAKSNPALAKKLRGQAATQQAQADALQKKADTAAKAVTDQQNFESLSVDDKAKYFDSKSTSLALSAERALAKANAESKEAAILMKSNRAAGLAMIAQAKADAATAAKLASQAQAAHKQAQSYYAQELKDRLQAAVDQQAFDAADTQGKADILLKRADAEQAKSDAAKAAASALIDKAKAIAATDAAQALKLLDQADEQAQIAKDAADAAEQDKQDAANLIGAPDSGPNPNIQPSRSVLEDAANVIDRYTASLRQAEEAAISAQPVVQFNQTNTSPEALSPSEIYRQTKNLLSAQEIKMGAD